MARNWRKIQREQETEAEQPMSESTDTETISRIEGMLEDLSLHGLTEVMEACKDRIAGKHSEAKQLLLSEFSDRAAQMGISMADLFPQTTRSRRSSGTIAPKYRNPQTGEQWSGRGVAAKWIREAKERGEDIESYRISEAA